MAHSICLSMNSIVTSVSLPNCDYLKQMCQRSIELLWKVCYCTALCLSSKDISFRVGKVLRWFLNLHWASNLGMVLVSFFFFSHTPYPVYQHGSAFRIYTSESQLFLTSTATTLVQKIVVFSMDYVKWSLTYSPYFHLLQSVLCTTVVLFKGDRLCHPQTSWCFSIWLLSV